MLRRRERVASMRFHNILLVKHYDMGRVSWCLAGLATAYHSGRRVAAPAGSHGRQNGDQPWTTATRAKHHLLLMLTVGRGYMTWTSGPHQRLAGLPLYLYLYPHLSYIWWR